MNEKAIALVSNLNCCQPGTPLQLLKTSTTAGTPVALVATRTYFRQAVFIGRKTLDGRDAVGDNTSAVVLGFDSAAAKQPIVIQSGQTYVLAATNGEKWNLAELYLDVTTSGDGVAFYYS